MFDLLIGVGLLCFLPSIYANSPTPSSYPTITYTHHNNPNCFYDASSLSHTWMDKLCTVDLLEYTTNYTTILPTIISSTLVELCIYSDATQHCDIYHNPQCTRYSINTCVQTSSTGWIILTQNNPNATSDPPTDTPSSISTPPPTSTPFPTTAFPTTQPPGQTIIYSSYSDQNCEIIAQPSHTWYTGLCVEDAFNDWITHIKPRLVTPFNDRIELCFYSSKNCNDYAIRYCRMYQSDVCIMTPSKGGSFRLQIIGSNGTTVVPTPSSTPTHNPIPTLTPTSTPTPPNSEPVFLFTHYDDDYTCTHMTSGYPHVWNQGVINYEEFDGQWFPFNATLAWYNAAEVCLETTRPFCELAGLNNCETGLFNSGMFKIQIMNFPYPIGATNIIETRYRDSSCQYPDVNATQSYVNGLCQNKSLHHVAQHVKANLLADQKIVQVCKSLNECDESRMTCEVVPLSECLPDASGSGFYRYTLSGPPTPAPPPSSSSGLSTAVWVGLIAGGVVLVLLIMGMICCCCKRRQGKQPSLHMQDGGYFRV